MAHVPPNVTWRFRTSRGCIAARSGLHSPPGQPPGVDMVSHNELVLDPWTQGEDAFR